MSTDRAPTKLRRPRKLLFVLKPGGLDRRKAVIVHAGEYGFTSEHRTCGGQSGASWLERKPDPTL
jgi:hypothetical protein